MTKALPGKKGWLAQIGDFAKAVFMPTVYQLVPRLCLGTHI
ncbi:MAG: hypothetical protein ACM65M_16610 [Microcoleus sp.]